MRAPASAVRIHSRLYDQLPTAYFHDAFELPLQACDKTALELYLAAVRSTPVWIDFLMTLRNRVVALFGLKNLGRLSDVDGRKSASAYQVGDRVGIFSIVSISDQEVVLGDADRHLKALVSVYKRTGTTPTAVVTTMVHVNNLAGRVYLFFVVPVHKLIVPVMLARIASASGRL